jgi:hypothetical protein
MKQNSHRLRAKFIAAKIDIPAQRAKWVDKKAAGGLRHASSLLKYEHKKLHKFFQHI